MSLPLNAFLKANPQLNQWTRQANQLWEIEKQLAQILPASLQRSCQLVQYTPPMLILSANNGAVAAKLRQMTDEIAEQLSLRGREVTLIRVQVQVSALSAKVQEKSIHLSKAGQNELAQFADSLGDSPMKSVLQRWVK